MDLAWKSILSNNTRSGSTRWVLVFTDTSVMSSTTSLDAIKAAGVKVGFISVLSATSYTSYAPDPRYILGGISWATLDSDLPTIISMICPPSPKCYHCDSVASVNDCNATIECSTGEKCIVTETLAADLTKSYRLGYATNEVCTQLFGASTAGSSLIIGRRSVDKRANLDGDCCDSDLCNQHTPSLARVRRQSNVTTSVVMASTTMVSSPEPTEPTNSKCSDIDTAGCQRLLGLNKGMCSDPCVVQAWPRTCGKCFECY